ncbi:MAG: TIGR03905 family TSCPD domain-containing protein [Erysipelotrichaceae bacterium]|nr:TIGR03905 family TSCPD domain-containing protein [Erysipelotrichaceae bacterium]
MKYEYQPHGVCSRLFTFDLADGKINDLQVLGGCNGNLKGIASLLKGMPIAEAIERLSGINCNNKGTSCPDQIAKALAAYQAQEH